MASLPIAVPSARDDDPHNDPEQAVEWDHERTIRAALIRWQCIDHTAKCLVDPRGVQIHAARIEDVLDLSFATVSFPLQFTACLFASRVELFGAQLEALYLQHSRSAAFSADGLKVRGNLSFRYGDATGEVRLGRAEIGGHLMCNNATFKNPGGVSLFADGIKVAGSVFLNSFNAEGELRLVAAHVGGNLECDSAKFRNEGKVALNADGIKVKHNVFLRADFRVGGDVRLVGAEILGQLNCSDCRFAIDSWMNAEPGLGQ